jgi:hypothetical protein
MTVTPESNPPGRLAYRLITGPDDAEFCRRVSDWVARGYVPYGNPTMAVSHGVLTVGQALVWPTSTQVLTARRTSTAGQQTITAETDEHR